MDDLTMSRDANTLFKLDEGFSEDSQNNGDHVQNSFVAWLNTQSAQAKADISYEILRTLRSTEIAAVVNRLNPLLHMDPVDKLPPEITAQIFSYLDASTLLTASLSSTTWRERVLDPKLWQELYHSQGWGIDLDEVKAFETAQSELMRANTRRLYQGTKSSLPYQEQPLSKRRATSGWMQSTPRRISADVHAWREQHGTVEADLDPTTELVDEEMTDLQAQSPQRPNKRQSQDSGDEMDFALDEPVNSKTPLHPELALFDDLDNVRLGWRHVYKQRQKLEQNWLKGRFTNFQLPHPNHPQEGHRECVYTIQFHGRWLVSGSRDKTLRIWDMDTRRLQGKPLVGHSQSVLCLQFDPTPDQDIIISGSSDSSIIVWKFSTGQRVQTISRAHDESVLNLRFDHRYLVTCSKDKKIRIWNRATLMPTDPDYPTARNGASCIVPTTVLDLTKIDISMLEAGLANGTFKALKPFSLLMTLDGHGAAVNAIQIHGDKVVSASGDRTIRIWDISTGVCVKVVLGHQKGIACVQYDGKRVVSGSSDNTVRIYDPISGTEVATLLGHSNLVRTVQAGFGDLPGSGAEEVAAARAAERKHLKNLETGQVAEDRHHQRQVRNGDFGSSRVAIGSNLPPGGGGSKWARIVSGSYDESIIIWKKNDEGDWVPGQILKQEEEDRAGDGSSTASQPSTSRPRRNQMRLRHDDPAVQQMLQTPANPPQAAGPSVDTQPPVAGSSASSGGNVMSASQLVQAAVHTSIASLQASVQNVTGLNRMVSGTTIAGNDIARQAIQNAVSQITANVQSVTQEAVTTAINNALANNARVTNYSSTVADLRTAQQQQQANAPQTPTAQAPRLNQNPGPVPGQSVSRVFKLQFDTRRIVCCSQDSRIIGWDFANGDVEIEQCARFFLGP